MSNCNSLRDATRHLHRREALSDRRFNDSAMPGSPHQPLCQLTVPLQRAEIFGAEHLPSCKRMTTAPRQDSHRRGVFLLEHDGLARRAMKFTVTSGSGVTEVVDRPESARAALEHVLVLLGRKRNDVRIFDEDGWRRTPADLCQLAAQEVAMLPDESGLSF